MDRILKSLDSALDLEADRMFRVKPYLEKFIADHGLTRIAPKKERSMRETLEADPRLAPVVQKLRKTEAGTAALDETLKSAFLGGQKLEKAKAQRQALLDLHDELSTEYTKIFFELGGTPREMC